MPKEDVEERYYFHVRGDFDLRSIRVPSASYRQLRKKIDWYLQPEQNDELTYDNFKKALKMINCYYRQISGRDECIAFHVKYIQPIEEFIIQHQTTIKP